MVFWFCVLASLLLPRCATDPTASTSISGSAIFTYESGEIDVALTVETNAGQTRIIAAALLYGVDATTGLRAPARSIEAGTSVIWPENLSFTLASCSQTPTLTSSQVYDTAKIFYYLYPTSCDASVGTTAASASLTVNREGQPTKTLNGSGSGSGGSTSLSQHTIFVTSTSYNGNIGSLSAADTLCQTRAAAGSATSSLSGSWKAILSTTTIAAASRIDLTNVPLKNTNGATVLSDARNLWGGSLLVAVQYNENGASAGSVVAWTSTNPNGTYNGPSCNNWTSNSAVDTALVGDVAATDTTWMITGATNDCSTLNRLYCINVN